MNNNQKGGLDKMQEQLTIHRNTCERCGHSWLPRSEEKPTICPKCKSPYWDKERKDKSKNPEND